VGHDPLVEFDECGAGLAEAAVVFRQLTEVREFAGWQGAEAGFPVVGPGDHSGSMEGTLVGGAATGGLAAASLEVVDAAFDELPQGEQGIDLTLIVGEQRLDGLTKAAGALGGSGQGRFSSLCYIQSQHKERKMFLQKMRIAANISGESHTTEGVRAS
jgi:hypothetical protein